MREIISKNTEQEILEGTFAYLVKCGLENISIRDLCKHLRLTQGALYYWFENKEDLLCQATIYGLQKISDKIFDYMFSNVNDLDEFFNHSLSNIKQYQNELRLVYQMAASPVYGTKVLNNSQFTPIYDKYSKELAKHIGCDWKLVQPLVYIFAACVLDFAIWDDKDEVEVQLNFIRSYLENLMLTYGKEQQGTTPAKEVKAYRSHLAVCGL